MKKDDKLFLFNTMADVRNDLSSSIWYVEQCSRLMDTTELIKLLKEAKAIVQKTMEKTPEFFSND